MNQEIVKTVKWSDAKELLAEQKITSLPISMNL